MYKAGGGDNVESSAELSITESSILGQETNVSSHVANQSADALTR